MNKKIFSHWLSWSFPLAIAIILGLTLFFDTKAEHVPVSINLAIIILSILLSYVAIEWAIFKIEFNDKLKSTNDIGSILNEFAEANMMMDNLMHSVKHDLVFDKKIKMDKEHLDFHLFVSKIKYQKFLSSHFVYQTDKKIIQKIPKYYFEDSIWKKLVHDSECYSSLQLLNNANTEFYLKDTTRRNLEITFLNTKLSQSKKESKLHEFHKLFILNDEWVNINEKVILDENIKTYLMHWLDKFKSLGKNDGKAELKVIKSSDAEGAIDGKPLKDIGIFDNILGIQSVYSNTESDFNTNSLRFDFSLDLKEVKDYKKDYDTIFKRAINLKDFFESKVNANAN